jgi:hypothetical protein
MRKLSPHSRPGKLAIVDGRTAEAQIMRRVRNDLTAHVGGQPSATQRMLIEQVASLTLRIHLMDRQALKIGETTFSQAKDYLCLTNSLSRLLKQLGMNGAPDRPTSIHQVTGRPRSMGAPELAPAASRPAA